eukprot:Rmarinus@m.29928
MCTGIVRMIAVITCTSSNPTSSCSQLAPSVSSITRRRIHSGSSVERMTKVTTTMYCVSRCTQKAASLRLGSSGRIHIYVCGMGNPVMKSIGCQVRTREGSSGSASAAMGPT